MDQHSLQQYRDQMEYAQVCVRNDLLRVDQLQSGHCQIDIKKSASRLQRKLLRLQYALHRLKNGLYGVCAACNQPVSSSRLRRLPYAELCATCQRQAEHLLTD